jgi:phage terminase large subunit-like protein
MRPYATIAHDYARRVVNGQQIAGKWIKLSCQRHLDDLAKTDWRWHFDAVKASKVCAFIESHKLDNGDPFVLQPWQIWVVASLVGWMDAEGTRKYIEAVIMCAKGSGKSPLIGCLGLWFAFFDGKKNSEVYCGATSLDQAMQVAAPAIKYVEQQPAYKKMGIVAMKKSIFSRTGAFFKPVVSRGKHGPKVYLGILDELHQAISADLYGTFKTGCNKVTNSLLVTISTAGVVSTENICYQLQIQAQKTLDGSLPDDRLFAALYCADDDIDWTSEQALLQANPNLGISSDSEKIRLAIQGAMRNPAHANNIKAMHLGIWSTAAVTWANMPKWAKCADPDLTEESVKHLPCWLGWDLASTLDLAASIRLHRQDIDGKPHYYCFTKAYLPEERVNAPENIHYQKWAAQGHLTATPGSSIDYSMIEADSLAEIANFQVMELAYDKRYADPSSQRVSETSGISRVEVAPSPAELSPAMKELEGAVADGRFHYRGELDPILTWCISNVKTKETAAGNYTMPDKDTPEAKIDCAIALFIAMARAMRGEVQQPSYGIMFA